MDLMNLPLNWLEDGLSEDPSQTMITDTSESYSQEFGPTPPHTPEYEQDSLDLLGDYPNDFMEEHFEQFEPQCRCQQPIVRDCMWSVNIPKTIHRSSSGQDSARFCGELSIPVLDSCSDCAGLESTPLCVDARTIFNLPCISKSPVKKQFHHNISSEDIIEERVCFIKSEAMEEYGSICISDDDYEVDVECLSDSSPDDLPYLPAHVPLSHSAVSAQIAEMHNYSQLSPPPSVSSARSCSRPSTTSYTRPSATSQFKHRTSSCRTTSSAPQSPSVPSLPAQFRPKHGTFSNPASPVVHARKHKNNNTSRNAKKRKLEQQRHRDHIGLMTPPGSDSDCEINRRAQHNVLERKRRNNLKEYFNHLRDQVPLLRSDVRTSKVVILQGAKNHISNMIESEKQVLAEKQRMIRQQQELKQRLQALRNAKARQGYL
uniref:Transcriptional regulator Myc n=1 Tax=Enchytraeus coronatus TaxID=208440 RepID=A0AAU7VFF7_9ANNE